MHIKAIKNTNRWCLIVVFVVIYTASTRYKFNKDHSLFLFANKTIKQKPENNEFIILTYITCANSGAKCARLIRNDNKFNLKWSDVEIGVLIYKKDLKEKISEEKQEELRVKSKSAVHFRQLLGESFYSKLASFNETFSIDIKNKESNDVEDDDFFEVVIGAEVVPFDETLKEIKVEKEPFNLKIMVECVEEDDDDEEEEKTEAEKEDFRFSEIGLEIKLKRKVTHFGLPRKITITPIASKSIFISKI